MFRHHHWRLAPAVAVTLALAAAAPASARPDVDPPQSVTSASSQTAATLCSEVCSGGYGEVTQPRVTSTLTGAAVPPDAWLRSVVDAGGGTSRHHDVTASEGYAGGPKVVASAPAARPIAVRAAAASAGFHWGDAGIGAGGAVALTMVLIGGALAVMKIRRRSTRGAAQPTT
jgi:hypothetical protein